MKQEPAREKHEVEMAALANIRCVCGWYNKIEKLKGKTDEDLYLESQNAFLAHKKRKGG